MKNNIEILENVRYNKLRKEDTNMNQNRKKPEKKNGYEKALAKLVFITAILNLIQAIVDLIKTFR